MRLRSLFFCSILFSNLLLAQSSFSQSSKVQFSFSPQGEVKNIGQVQVLFKEPMVPLGDPKRSVSPFTIDCPVKGEERWVTETDWVYEFPQTLEGGIRCKFTTNSIKSLAGNSLEPGKVFSFHTGGPLVTNVSPYEGAMIAEDQAFVVQFDSEPKLSDVSEKVYFAMEGLGNKIPIRILQGRERENILKVTRDDPKSKKVFVIGARQLFPADVKLRLVVEKGLRSSSGIASSSDWATTFQVRSAFTATLHCERVNANAGCVPISPVYLSFSSPINKAWRNQIFIKFKDGKLVTANKKESEDSYYEEESSYSVSFPNPLPPQNEFEIILPKSITDDMGRSLQNMSSFPLKFRTDEYPPLVKFSSGFGIVEKFPEALLPVTVRNVEAPVIAKHLNPIDPSGEGELIHEQWAKLSEKGKDFLGNLFGPKQETKPSGKSIPARSIVVGPSDVRTLMRWLVKGESDDHQVSIFSAQETNAKKFGIPSPNGEKRFEVIGIPLKKSGLHIIEIESPILGQALHEQKNPYYVRTAALVTNLSIHFKWGKSSSLVWVTSLDKGQSVEGVEVGLFDCRGSQLWKGNTDASGRLLITENQSRLQAQNCGNEEPFYSGLFLVAKKGEDFSFLHTSWDNGIETWRYKLSHDSYDAEFKYRTILDRTLFREGETVHMNHILRKTDPYGFRYPNSDEIPDTLYIQHNASGQQYELPLRWSNTFTSESTFAIPKEAILGEYSIYLKFKLRNGSERKIYSGGFTTAQFRLPLLKGELQADSNQLISPKDIQISGQVSYLSGGKAGLLPITLRSSVQNTGGVHFPSYPDLEFSNGRTSISNSANDEESDSSGQKPDFKLIQSKTDENGFLSEKVSIPKKLEGVRSLNLEMEWKDPNGEIQTISRSFKLLPSKNLIAIQNEDWVAVKNKLKSKVIIVDASGNPVPSKKAIVKAFSIRYISHRKRLVGGFYSYDHRSERKDLGEVCSGLTDSKGILECKGSVSQAGQLYLEARVDGEDSYANTSIWIVNEQDIWFGSTDHDRMDLLPEKRKYEPGEIAKFQVRMPFKTATALVTVEREGVFKSFVQTLSGNQPVVEVPIESHYGPNIFVSVLAVRGRVDSPKATALVDLAKPAYRMGVAEIQVGWKPYELDLTVSTDKQEYRPREKAKVKIRLSEKDKAVWKDSKITVAAVDESLLELKQNLSWNLLQAMMAPRGIQVQTSTAQMFVIGRRHFGLKSLPPGGGGGLSSTRELFDTLLFWKADMVPNSNGELEFEVPLNDSLSSFKIVAVAAGGASRFGTASSSIRTSQEILAYASVSPLVREGDRIQAGISLKNTSQKQIDLSLSVKSEPDLKLQRKNVSLGPNASETIYWEFEIPRNITEIKYEFGTEASSINFKDAFVFKQKVDKPTVEQILQANFYQLSPTINIPLQEPEDAEPNRSKVEVSLYSSLVSGPIEGIQNYMGLYPYNCLEQKLSKAVSAGNEASWNSIMTDLPKYMDSDGLLRFFPDSISYGNVPLTTYLLLLSSESGWQIPDKSRDAMVGALHRFIDGTLYRTSPLATTDTLLRKISALEAVSKFGNVEASKIRAIETDPNRLPIESLISLRNLYRQVNWDAKKRQRVDEILRSKLRIQGSSYELTSDSSYLWWLLSSRDTVTARFLNSILNDQTWKEETPKLLRGFLNNTKSGHYDITTANAFAALAFRKYQKEYESNSVSGEVRLSLSSQSQSFDWEKKEGKLQFEFPKGRSELNVEQKGSGQPYAYVKTSSAIPLKKPIHSGLRVEKQITDLQGATKTSFKEGDVVKVKIKIKSEFSVSWLALKDPVPAGASVLGSGLGRDSALLSESQTSWWDSPSFVERKFEGVTAYYEYFFPGEITYEYIYRINSPGNFRLPPTRVEALYQPEVYSVIPNSDIVVQSNR
ncbi:alpha-2-macroglobulin family protein [Leptospira langatensis]|nr:MG2 domain-containing protein [Leptospira langatensis]